jgi:hypothetical protein
LLTFTLGGLYAGRYDFISEPGVRVDADGAAHKLNQSRTHRSDKIEAAKASATICESIDFIN